MKKPAIAFLLTCAVLIAITPAIAAAAAMDMTVNKTKFVPGERMSVTVTGVTQEVIDRGNVYIYVCTPEQEHGDYIDYSGLPGGTGTKKCEIAAPNRPGNYEYRLYDDEHSRTAASIVKAIPFTVAAAPPSAPVPGDFSMSVNKTDFVVKERITITVKGITKEITDRGNVYVYICSPGQEHGDYLSHGGLPGGTGVKTCDTEAPGRPGDYELRLYNDEHFRSAASIAQIIPIKVGTTAPPNTSGMSMSVDKTGFAAGEMMTVTVTGVTQEVIDRGNVYVYVCSPDQEHGDYIDCGGLPGGTGTKTVEIDAPGRGGVYELRLYSDEHFRSAAAFVQSIPFTVGNAVLPAATPKPVQAPTPAPAPQAGALTAEAVDSGVKLSWPAAPGALGCRIYRSQTEGEEGQPITDFIITGENYIDVNVDADTTYFYSYRLVLKEAGEAAGAPESLSAPSAEFSGTTGGEILGGNASDLGEGVRKNFILMKLDDPAMSVNGVKQEIDPGRGTAPLVRNGRTMVPIRAIIESMGGTVDWDDETQKISLAACGHAVEMWLNKKDLVADGQEKEMDVAPVEINGRTMVPVRFAAENAGCAVDWINSTSEIVIVFYTEDM